MCFEERGGVRAVTPGSIGGDCAVARRIGERSTLSAGATGREAKHLHGFAWRVSSWWKTDCSGTRPTSPSLSLGRGHASMADRRRSPRAGIDVALEHSASVGNNQCCRRSRRRDRQNKKPPCRHSAPFGPKSRSARRNPSKSASVTVCGKFPNRSGIRRRPGVMSRIREVRQPSGRRCSDDKCDPRFARGTSRERKHGRPATRPAATKTGKWRFSMADIIPRFVAWPATGRRRPETSWA